MRIVATLPHTRQPRAVFRVERVDKIGDAVFGDGYGHRLFCGVGKNLQRSLYGRVRIGVDQRAAPHFPRCRNRPELVRRKSVRARQRHADFRLRLADRLRIIGEIVKAFQVEPGGVLELHTFFAETVSLVKRAFNNPEFF